MLRRGRLRLQGGVVIGRLDTVGRRAGLTLGRVAALCGFAALSRARVVEGYPVVLIQARV